MPRTKVRWKEDTLDSLVPRAFFYLPETLGAVVSAKQNMLFESSGHNEDIQTLVEEPNLSIWK